MCVNSCKRKFSSVCRMGNNILLKYMQTCSYIGFQSLDVPGCGTLQQISCNLAMKAIKRRSSVHQAIPD